MSLPPWARRAATALLVVAAGAYLVHTVAANLPQMRAFPWRVRPGLLALSVALHVGVLAWGVWVWARVLDRFEHPPVRQGTLQRIWFLSNLARYIPGKVFQFLAAAQLSRAAGLSAAVLVTSMLVHAGFSLLAAVLVSAWTLGGALLPALPPAATGALATAGAALLVHPALLNAGLGTLSRVTRRPVMRWTASWGAGIGLLGLSVLAWGLYGGAYWCFLRSVADVPAGLLPELSGVNALSFVAGYLAFFTAGGIGVREVIMKELLDPYLPAAVAAVLAVAARLWTIAAELAGGALAVWAARGSLPSPAPAEGAPEDGGARPDGAP